MKCVNQSHFAMIPRRSRKGAWIEIIIGGALSNSADSRSRKGAWIEMMIKRVHFPHKIVAPARERGLKY